MADVTEIEIEYKGHPLAHIMVMGLGEPEPRHLSLWERIRREFGYRVASVTLFDASLNLPRRFGVGACFVEGPQITAVAIRQNRKAKIITTLPNPSVIAIGHGTESP